MNESTIVIYIVVSMIVLLVISFSVLWFFYYSQNKIIKLVMQDQANKIEFQKNLLLNTVKTQENERNRISAELHDDIGSRLNIIHLNVHLLKKKVADNTDVARIIDHIETSLDESIGRTRSISHELMPPVLRKFGFHHALHEFVQAFNATGNIKVTVHDDHLCSVQDEFKQLHLFRILQELMSNTLKYAGASEVVIKFSFSQSDNIIQMTYADNGMGFDQSQESSGLGLSNIKTRTELLQGESKIGSDDNSGGFRFVLKFPGDE